MENIKTTIHCYYYNLNNEADRLAYEALCATRRAAGVLCFATLQYGAHAQPNGSIGYYYKPLDGQTVELEPAWLFDNQWNTAPNVCSEKGLRVFDWAENIFPNAHIKSGHWLEITPEMTAARANRIKCHYCGKQYEGPQAETFCNACLDSPYLQPKDFPLTRLAPIGCNKFPELTADESAERMPLYKDAQLHGKTERAKQQHADKRARLLAERDKVIYSANRKYDGFTWLLDHSLNVDNVIYYSHTDTFCIGWCDKGLTAEMKAAWTQELADFPFKWEFHKEVK